VEVEVVLMKKIKFNLRWAIFGPSKWPI